MTAPLRVSFASGVRHALPYLQLLGRDPRVKIVGVAEHDDCPDWMIADSRRTAAEAGVPWLGDIAHALNAQAVDLVVVCSEPTRHAQLALEAFENGIDVLVDKPVATTLADADAIAAAARRTGRVCAVINRTHAPGLRRARAWVDAGHLGLPRHIDVEFLASGAHFTTSVERPELVIDPALSGGGELLNFLGYCVDSIRYLTGIETTSVYAMAGALFDNGHARFGVEDTAVVSLGLEHGVTATVTVGRVPFAPGLGPTSTSIRLLGSHGHASIDDDRPAVTRYGREPIVASHAVGGVGSGAALAGFFTDLVDALVAGRTPDYGIADARASISVIDAAYRAIASGAVTVPR
ncbi:oxidoreductase [Subtercola boreus]|uniref:Oxidoreductase n=1 Tax=Subtercola boreus TaxID=120213 RepID=A0A3E0W2X5_9MICO|nr:Gfo/Idh/MocA family oxidoreductase [Subtercola boreus]RFA16340.1 oxidoreductase [Subtercola boreus]